MTTTSNAKRGSAAEFLTILDLKVELENGVNL